MDTELNGPCPICKGARDTEYVAYGWRPCPLWDAAREKAREEEQARNADADNLLLHG
jgi:hypothetical protein